MPRKCLSKDKINNTRKKPLEKDYQESERNVILEVWREDVRAFQIPDELYEPALGGPDTTTRDTKGNNSQGKTKSNSRINYTHDSEGKEKSL